ncbi:hypothetical protein [Dickeya chrysanthemi]|uniref:hypothetical protein n=1 Tax=Dickeya chrysanthemi TaxID=556 RepID=UPI001CF12F58|nr:hypothetical protein [Dickeya chrysanthemi]MCA7008286.1 hypothetical protein [Dickeya chrysanthemi]
MKNEHEIIGEAVEDLLGGDLQQFFSRDLLAQYLMREFMRVAETDAHIEERQLYESAMRIVAGV